MTRTKTTKKALFTSLLSLLLCVAMLIGSTFAWFTDSVTSGRNKIMAGNLDLEVEYAPANAARTGDKINDAEWKKLQDSDALFNDGALWEPGHTEYVYLRIRNAGSLALQYEIEANVYGDATGGPENTYTAMTTDAEGNHTKFKLSDYLVYRSIENAEEVADRASLWIENADEEKAAMGNTVALYGTKQKLLKGEEKLLTLAIYMPTSVGNEANWAGAEIADGEAAPEIYLGISLRAGQVPQESDSFDNTYDENAFKTRCELNGHKYGSDDLCVYCGAKNPIAYKTEGGKAVVEGLAEGSDVTELEIPGELNGLPVEIKEGAFQNNDTLESVTIGEGITVIPDNAFFHCSSLTYASIPETVKEIGFQAFKDSVIEGDVNLPNLDTIGQLAFSNTHIESLKIGNKLINSGFGTYAFNGCSELKTVEFADDSTITSIPYSTFNGCVSLTHIELPNTVTSIGDYAFKACASLETFDNANVTSLGTGAFVDSGLVTVNLPKVTSVGTNAFRSDYETGTLPSEHPTASKLTTVTLGSLDAPLSSITIGEGAFYGCKVLTNINIYSSKLKLVQWCFNGCASLSTVNFSGNIAAWNEAHNGLRSWHNEAPTDTVIHCSDGDCDWEGNRIP